MANYSIYTEGKTFFYRLDPRPKLILLLMVIILVMVSSSMWLNMIVFALSTLFAMIAVDFRKIFRTLKIFIPLLSLILILWPIFKHEGDVLFNWWIITVTSGGLIYAVAMFFRILSMLIMSLTVFMSIKTVDLVTLMDKARFPYTYSYAAMISLNFLPEFASSAKTVLNAQQARGLDVKKQNFILGIKNLATLLPPLMTLVFKKADTLSLSMDSLAFGAFKSRTFLRSKELTMSGFDWLFSVLVVLVAAGLFFLSRLL